MDAEQFLDQYARESPDRPIVASVPARHLLSEGVLAWMESGLVFLEVRPDGIKPRWSIPRGEIRGVSVDSAPGAPTITVNPQSILSERFAVLGASTQALLAALSGAGVALEVKEGVPAALPPWQASSRPGEGLFEQRGPGSTPGPLPSSANATPSAGAEASAPPLPSGGLESPGLGTASRPAEPAHDALPTSEPPQATPALVVEEAVKERIVELNMAINASIAPPTAAGCVALVVLPAVGVGIGVAAQSIVVAVLLVVVLGVVGLVITGSTVDAGNAWYFQRDVRPQLDEITEFHSLTREELLQIARAILPEDAPFSVLLAKDLEQRPDREG